MSYQAYLASPEWKRLREQARKRAGHQCEHCGGSPDHVHHVRYPKNLKDDVLENLIVVCESCHMKHHGIRGEKMSNALVLPFNGVDVCIVNDGNDLLVGYESIQKALGIKDVPWGGRVKAELEDSDWKMLQNPFTLKIEPFLIDEAVLIIGMRFGMNAKARGLRRELAQMKTGKNTKALTVEDQLIQSANALKAHRIKLDEHENRILELENQEKTLIKHIQEKASQLEVISSMKIQDINSRINRTVAAPGQFTIRSYLLMLDINPEQKMTGVPIKQLIGKRCAEIGRARGIKPGKMVEGTFEVNTWPANIIEDALDEIGIVYVKNH